LLNFLVREFTFQSIFWAKKISEEVCPKIDIGKDPDPVKNHPDPQHCFFVFIGLKIVIGPDQLYFSF
jgi:hypothetical protein